MDNKSQLSVADTSKFALIREFVKGEPQAIFILAGAMKYNEIEGRYESGDFNDTDENSIRATGVALATGGKDRVLAAAELHQIFPEAQIVTMSRTRDETKPTYAAVMRDELIQNGVPRHKIFLEQKSVTTVTEFKEAARMILKEFWNNVVIITSDWHIPRSKALLNHIENFVEGDDESSDIATFANALRSGELTIQFVSSTDVLQLCGLRYQVLFDELSGAVGMQERRAQEQIALKQIADGEYGGVILSQKIFE